MQGNKSKITIVLLVFFLIGCAQPRKKMEIKAYEQFITTENNGCYESRIVNGFQFELLYLPLEYKAIKEIRDKTPSIALLEKEKTNFSGMTYFTLKISPEKSDKSILKYNLKSNEDYQARLAYFSFGLQKDIYLEQGDLKIPCTLYHFERAYDLSKFRVFNLAFEDKLIDKNKDFTLVIASDFFQSGRIKFKYKKTELEKIPELTIK